jgi:hypothetical protein
MKLDINRIIFLHISAEYAVHES